MDRSENGTALLAVRYEGSRAGTPERPRHPQQVNCFQHAGLAAAVSTVKHINPAQASKLDLSQVSHGVNIKLCERHALYCFSLVWVVRWVVARDVRPGAPEAFRGALA